MTEILSQSEIYKTYAVWALGGLLAITVGLYMLGVNGAISSVLAREQFEKQIAMLKTGMTEKELIVSERADSVTFAGATSAGFVKVAPQFVQIDHPVVGFNAR